MSRSLPGIQSRGSGWCRTPSGWLRRRVEQRRTAAVSLWETPPKQLSKSRGGLTEVLGQVVHDGQRGLEREGGGEGWSWMGVRELRTDGLSCSEFPSGARARAGPSGERAAAGDESRGRQREVALPLACSNSTSHCRRHSLYLLSASGTVVALLNSLLPPH